MQGYSVTMPKDAQESGGGLAAPGTEGRAGSAGSNEGASKEHSSGEVEMASEPRPPSAQQQVIISRFIQATAGPRSSSTTGGSSLSECSAPCRASNTGPCTL